MSTTQSVATQHKQHSRTTKHSVIQGYGQSAVAHYSQCSSATCAVLRTGKRPCLQEGSGWHPLLSRNVCDCRQGDFWLPLYACNSACGVFWQCLHDFVNSHTRSPFRIDVPAAHPFICQLQGELYVRVPYMGTAPVCGCGTKPSPPQLSPSPQLHMCGPGHQWP
jgi:hypothetical protein